MKKYYIQYPRDFANEYTLVSCETEDDVAMLHEFNVKHCPAEHGFQRISVRAMRKKISAEKIARKYDPAFAGYGDIAPTPVKEYIKGYVDR